MAPVLFVVGIIAVVALAIYFGWYAKKKRREELAGIAASLGLEYSANDPYGFDSYPFELFGRGEARGRHPRSIDEGDVVACSGGRGRR